MDFLLKYRLPPPVLPGASPSIKKWGGHSSCSQDFTLGRHKSRLLCRRVSSTEGAKWGKEWGGGYPPPHVPAIIRPNIRSGNAAYLTDIFLIVLLKHNDNGLIFAIFSFHIVSMPLLGFAHHIVK